MPKTNQEYLADPVHCPYCNHHDIESKIPSIFDDVCVSKVSCNNCEREWSDIYRLASYEGEGDDSNAIAQGVTS